MKRVSARQLLITFLPSISILVAMVVVSILFQVSMLTMTQDVTAIAKLDPLSGLLSNLGILLWCAAASICFYTATILRNVKQRETFWFLLSSGLLSAYLLFDDFFQIHEALAPRYLGLNEQVVYAALGIAVSAYLIAFRRIILRTNFGILLSAIGFLASSVVIDAVLEPWLWRLGDWEYFFEDGAKWLGIASWCSYYVHTSHQFLVSSLGLPNNAIQPDAYLAPLISNVNARDRWQEYAGRKRFLA